MNLTIALPVLAGTLGSYWLYWNSNKKSGRGLMALAASLILGSAFFFENIIGLLLVCVAESIVVIDRFLTRRKKHTEGLEREFSGLFLLAIPFFVFLANKLHVSYEVSSAMLVVFFFLRLLRWPQKLPFEGLKSTRFHNDFVFFWCNAAIFYLCRDLILVEHSIFFAFGALMNAIVGFSSGAFIMLLLFLATGFILPTTVLGPIGILMSLGRKWIGVAAALLGVVAASDISMDLNRYYIVLGTATISLIFISLIKDEISAQIPIRKQAFLGGVAILSVAALLSQSQEELFLVDDARWIAAGSVAVLLLLLGRFPAFMPRTTDPVQWDWQGKIFQFITKIDAPVGKDTRELPDAFQFEEEQKPPGTLGQYLLWMFVLVFFLLLGGQA